MALNLDNFITPEQNFGGLYKLGDTLERNKQRNEIATQRDSANRSSMAKFLTDYLDPKEHLSGSPYDPQVTKGYMDLLNEGAQLIKNNKGLTTDMLLTALSPKVNRLSQYASTAKSISQQLKERGAQIPDNSGYDKFALMEQAKKTAFYNPDGSLKDISTVDPNIDWISETVKQKPELVTNNKGIDEWLKGQTRMPNSTDVTVYNERGGRQRQKVKTTAYDWAVPDTDANGVHTRKFVPEFDHAVDGGNAIVHEFTNPDGTKVKAPVRAVTDRVFNTILSNSPGTADWVRGQVNQHINSGDYKDANGDKITIDSPQAKTLAKTILYDELKSRGLGSMEDVQESKPTQIKVYAPKTPKQPSEAAQNQQEAINNLHLTLNDTAPDEKGNLDVSPLLNGIKFLNKYNDQIVIKSATFNPKTKDFTVQTDKGEEIVPYHRLATLAATANPQTDMKWLKGFKTYERGADANNIPKPKERTFFDSIKNAVKRGADVLKPKKKDNKVTDPALLKQLNGG